MDYLTIDRPLTDAQTPDMMQTETRSGTPTLRIKLYYYKDGRRGLKLSVTRCFVGEHFTTTSLGSRYNGLLHVKDLPRKNDKIGNEMAEAIRQRIDTIQTIALASFDPDWQAVLGALASAADAQAA